MRRGLIGAIVILLAAGAGVSAQERPERPVYTPPEGVVMEINLYPETRFRGRGLRLRESDPDIRGAFAVQSAFLVRGIWELCSERNFYGRCIRVQGSVQSFPVPITTRSARLIGDTGPAFVESPQARAGPDVPIPRADSEVVDRPTPGPVIAPRVDEGGVAGADTALKGKDAEFFPTPSRDGLRVLACPSGAATARCATATADGFCIARGYRDSAWHGLEVVNGKTYLADVLCKTTPDVQQGFRIPLPFR